MFIKILSAVNLRFHTELDSNFNLISTNFIQVGTFPRASNSNHELFQPLFEMNRTFFFQFPFITQSTALPMSPESFPSQFRRASAQHGIVRSKWLFQFCYRVVFIDFEFTITMETTFYIKWLCLFVFMLQINEPNTKITTSRPIFLQPFKLSVNVSNEYVTSLRKASSNTNVPVVKLPRTIVYTRRN